MNTQILQKADHELDASGLNCPLPILKTRNRLKEISSGETLHILSTDPGSVADIAAFCKQTGNELLDSSYTGTAYEFLVRKI